MSGFEHLKGKDEVASRRGLLSLMGMTLENGELQKTRKLVTADVITYDYAATERLTYIYLFICVY
jgi:hypothetical protein